MDRADEAGLRIAAAGLVPAGELEPDDETARAWVAVHGPVTAWRVPDGGGEPERPVTG